MTSLLRPLGQGPHATVHEGQTGAGARVAVKVLDPQTRQNSRRRERIFSAAATWAKMSQPHVLRYLDVDLAKCWILMELMTGSAATQIARQPTSPEDAARVLQQSLEALKSIHAKGFLHGNIKPTNVLFDARQEVCLADGYALSLANPGVLPAPDMDQKYIAPELTGTIGTRLGPGLDLYCLGFTILEMLVGPGFGKLFPGVGDQQNQADVAWFRWHSSQEPAPTVSSAVPACPHALAVVIDRMLLKDPMQRYHTAQQALEDLAGLRFDAAAAPATANSSPTVGAGPPAPMPTRNKQKPTGSSSATADMISPRPRHGILLRIASGSQAGRWIGMDADEISIGTQATCDVVLEPDADAGDVSARIRVWRAAEGWFVEQVEGDGLFVNRDRVENASALRSGDILRITWRGPDVQFIMQSSGMTVNELAARYLPAGRRPQPAAPGAGTPAAAAPKMPSPPAQSPNQPAPSGSASEPPRTPAASPAPAAPVRPAAPAAPVRPASPAARGPAPPSAPSPSAPKPMPAARAASSPASGVETSAAQTSFMQYLLRPSEWDKNTKNWVVGIISAMIGLTIVFLIPTKKSNDEPPDVPAATAADESQESPK